MAWIVADMTDCLKVECSGTSIVTSNLGSMYSATKNVLWNTWSSTVTVTFQSPSTGDSDNWNSDAKTPRVVSARLQCFTRLPLPSFNNNYLPLLGIVQFKFYAIYIRTVIKMSNAPVTVGFKWEFNTIALNCTLCPGLYTALSVWIKTE